MLCSLYFASLFCFQQPLICNHYETHQTKTAIFTAYNLEAAQTDQDFCTGAGNHNLCAIQRENTSKCIVATRLFDLHTKLYVEGFGECEVLDRTSKKYGDRFDILMPTKKEAFKFGKQTLEYYVIQN